MRHAAPGAPLVNSGLVRTKRVQAGTDEGIAAHRPEGGASLSEIGKRLQPDLAYVRHEVNWDECVERREQLLRFRASNVDAYRHRLASAVQPPRPAS
jgi:hypothetical protein